MLAAKSGGPMRRVLSLAICVLLTGGWATAQGSQPQATAVAPLYRASLVQAAPGKLTDLIAAYKQHFAAAGQTPLWMRHSQGDRWDLLILEPMTSYTAYYAPDRAAARERDGSAWEQRRRPMVAWEEDVFVYGPPEADLRKAFGESGFFHVEMFRALADKRAELLQERKMENAYAKAIGQPENFIFLRDQGASWDNFTIGCFRDIKHYASSADVPPEKTQAAAKGAGFDSPAAIGPYLRQFIADHHDTLAVAIK
jgi:hypothetical protein